MRMCVRSRLRIESADLPDCCVSAPAPRHALNETYREDGAIIHKHACALGCEGIVSKRLGSPSDSNIHFK